MLEEIEVEENAACAPDLRAESLPLTRTYVQQETSSELCNHSKSTAIKGFNGTSSKHRTYLDITCVYFAKVGRV